MMRKMAMMTTTTTTIMMIIDFTAGNVLFIFLLFYSNRLCLKYEQTLKLLVTKFRIGGSFYLTVIRVRFQNNFTGLFSWTFQLRTVAPNIFLRLIYHTLAIKGDVRNVSHKYVRNVSNTMSSFHCISSRNNFIQKYLYNVFTDFA